MRPPGPGMVRRYERDRLVVEERRHGETGAGCLGVDEDGDIKRALAEPRCGVERGLRPNLDIHSRKRLAEAPQKCRQPVVSRVALGRETQHADASVGDRANVVLRPAEGAERDARRAEHGLTGRREHQPTPDPLEQRRSQPPLGLLELLRSGRLRQREPSRGLRQCPFLDDGFDEGEVTEVEGRKTH